MTQDEKRFELLPNATWSKVAAREPLLHYPTGAKADKSVAADPEKGGVPGEQEKAVGGVPAASSRVFNRGERPVQDALWGRMFLGGMLLLALLLLFLVVSAVLSPGYFSAEGFSNPRGCAALVLPLVLLVSVPVCLLLAWSFPPWMTPAWIRVSLVLGILLFPPVIIAVIILFLYCAHLFPLVSLMLSDSTKFIATRGRALIFLIASVSAVYFLGSILVYPSALMFCDNHSDFCNKWTSASTRKDLLSDPLIAPILLGLFLCFWLTVQVLTAIQFIAAHVVGQCYGNSQVTVEEGDLHTVILATKCAFKESFGTISLISLVSVGVSVAAILLNLLIIWLMGDSALAAVPLVLIYGALFIFTAFLTSFVVPIVAITGQSFLEAMYSGFFLAKRNLVAAVTSTVCTFCVVGVLSSRVLLAMLFVGFILAGIVAQPYSGTSDFTGHFIGFWFLTMLSTAVSLSLFLWGFSNTMSSTFVLFALDGKAHEGTTGSLLFPVGVPGASEIV